MNALSVPVRTNLILGLTAALFIFIGCFFFTTPANAQSLSQDETIAVVEQGIEITLEGAKLVLKAVQESLTPRGNVLGASTDAEASMEALVAALSENVRIYKDLIERQSLTARAIVTKPTITVTSPNGGEQWDLGLMNTVTWTPYGYDPDVNPSSDVTAYLERKDGSGKGSKAYTVLGKVQESGKASIHWITGELNSATEGNNFASPGDNYYIRVVNNVTKVSDRSDGPFSILPKPIVISVNGVSDQWVAVDAESEVTISWETAPGVSACQLSGIKEVPFTDIQPSSGSVTGHVEYEYTLGGAIYSVVLQCVKNKTQIQERAKLYLVNIPGVLEITSPNGGEMINPQNVMNVDFKQIGISSYSVALYKNDQWKYWIAKDVIADGGESQRISWVPSNALVGLGEGDNAGAIFKIYVTGQKMDGTGYVDDKSDAPFSFIAPGISVDTYTTSANVSVVDGNLNDTATFRINLDVTAVGDDAYISMNPATSIRYAIRDGANLAAATGTRTATLASDAEVVNTTYFVPEGATKRFTLAVTYRPGVANTAARLQLNAIIFGLTATTPTGKRWDAIPSADYRTNLVSIVN